MNWRTCYDWDYLYKLWLMIPLCVITCDYRLLTRILLTSRSTSVIYSTFSSKLRNPTNSGMKYITSKSNSNMHSQANPRSPGPIIFPHQTQVRVCLGMSPEYKKTRDTSQSHEAHMSMQHDNILMYLIAQKEIPKPRFWTHVRPVFNTSMIPDGSISEVPILPSLRRWFANVLVSG